MNKEFNPFKTIDNNSIDYAKCMEYLNNNSESKEIIFEAVDNVVKFIDNSHRYSMSRIYSLWNFIYKRNEVPQSCASCLIRKSHDLKKWRDTQLEADRDTLAEKRSKSKRKEA